MKIIVNNNNKNNNPPVGQQAQVQNNANVNTNNNPSTAVNNNRSTPVINNQNNQAIPAARNQVETANRPPRQRKKKYKSKLDDGYNSGDEYYGSSRNDVILTNEEFEELLKKTKGWIVRRMKEDGNCLFRSVADHVYGDQEMHDIARTLCMNHMEAEREHFSEFITEDFKMYIDRKKKDRTYGNNLEIQAMAELYNRPIEVLAVRNSKIETINIFHTTYESENPPIRLSYHTGNHYNSIIDPNRPAFGVGLGLPSLKPGLADDLQVHEATTKSEEQYELEAALKASEVEDLDKLILETYRENEEDWYETQRELEEAVLAMSEQEYLESLYNPKP